MGKEEERTRVKTKEKSPHLEPTASRDLDSSQHVGTSHQRQRERRQPHSPATPPAKIVTTSAMTQRRWVWF
jgi:hypothetical protein